jgi:CTP:molybdopterin cytidylyltransferase MocA
VARSPANVIVGIVLAAGRSSRFGSPKALAVLEGETLAALAVRTLSTGGCDSVVVVVGPPHEAALRAALTGVELARNSEPERGMLSSLQVGLARVSPMATPTAVVFSLVDHPRVRPDTVARLIAEWRSVPERSVRPLHAGRGGHPVVLGPSALAAVTAAEPGATLRDVVRAAGGFMDVAVDDPGVLHDVDLPEDLARLAGSAEPSQEE